MERIGFVGLGNMGKPMAERLARAGFPLTVLDLNPAPVADLVKLGAKAAETPRQLAERSDIICSVVMNDRQTMELFLASDGNGILAGAAPGALLVIHSTVNMATCHALAEAGREKSVHVIDAAVSGAAARAREGTLTLMVGGDAAQVARARPLFEAVGTRTYHMGELGMGQAAKICNNLMCLVNVQVAEEALRLARAAGIDQAAMREVALQSSGQSWALQNLQEMRELGRIHAGEDFDMSIFGRKDISLASKLAAALTSPAPITDFVFDLMKK
jgi:3-hydroxyisobutyrate dehydrogenase-like beta-hydroxyacid dehydrogenase